MAMNPMQRRARTSFIFGFLVALIVGAIAVMALLMKIKSINEAKEALEALQKKVYVASQDLESGQEVTMADFMMGTVQTTVDKTTMLEDSDFEFTDDNGDVYTKIDEEGNPIDKIMVMKINVPAGTIITKDMMYESGEELDDTDRIQEFNMIGLPSQLKNGDYIDVRLSLPNGQDFIVLSKKKVLGTTTTSVWLKLNEFENSLMNNAIVESYKITGSKLRAIEYIESGMQKEAIPTYIASTDVTNSINKNPNIIDEIKSEYAGKISDLSEFRANNIESALDATRDGAASLVEKGNSDERQSIKAERKAYVNSLQGTEDVGYTK